MEESCLPFFQVIMTDSLHSVWGVGEQEPRVGVQLLASPGSTALFVSFYNTCTSMRQHRP